MNEREVRIVEAEVRRINNLVLRNLKGVDELNRLTRNLETKYTRVIEKDTETLSAFSRAKGYLGSAEDDLRLFGNEIMLAEDNLIIGLRKGV